MANKKIQMQDSKGNIIYPATVSELVTYGSGNVNDTLIDLEARDELFISDTVPDKDGLWVDTSDQNSSPNGENIVATQIKKYIDEKITSKVDDCVEKVDEMEKDILSTNFNHIVTNQYSTALTDTKNGFANHEIIEGNTLQNYFVISNKTVTNENVGGERFTFYQKLQQQAVQVDGVYTLVNLSDKKLVLSKFNISTTAWDCEITLNPSEKKVINMGTISRFNAMFGRVEEGWTQDNCHLLPTSVLLLKGDWSDKEVPYRYFNGLASVGEHQPISIAVVSEDEPHKEEIQLIHEPLRAIGDIKDTIDVDRGVVIRRIGKIILDGSETWNRFNDSSNGVNSDKWYFYTKQFNMSLTENAIADSLVYAKNSLLIEKSFYISPSLQEIGIRNYDYSTSEQLKTYLKANPITVLYELQTPVEEKINIAPLRLFEEARSVELISNIKPTVTFNYPTNLKSIVESNINAINKLYDERTVVSNPNFLINGGFRVNQRGKSEYTDSGKYSVDRWQFNTSSGGSLAVKDDYISLTNKNDQNTYLRYYFEDDDAKFLDGKTVTVSVLYRSTETFRVKLGRLDGILLPPTQDWTLKTHTINLSSWRYTNRHDDSSLILQAYNNSKYTNGTLDVKWIKLELGDKPTPFVPKPYFQELADCQRYYEVLNSRKVYGSGVSLSNNTAEFNIPFNRIKRIRPSISFSSQEGFIVNNGNYQASGTSTITQLENDTDRILISCTTKEPVLTNGNCCILQRNDNITSMIYIDAEIY